MYLEQRVAIADVGDFTLDPADPKLNLFRNVVGAGFADYAILDGAGVLWESGLGKLGADGTFTRAIVTRSSNSGNKVPFPAGTKLVFLTGPSTTTFTDAAGNAVTVDLLNGRYALNIRAATLEDLLSQLLDALLRTADAAQRMALLGIFTTSANGLVPASGSAIGNFLRDDGTFAAPPSGGSGLLASNNTWTGSNTFQARSSTRNLDYTVLDLGSISGAVTVDWTTYHRQKLQLANNLTLSFTAPAGPASLILMVKTNAATSTFTIAWPATVKWPGNVTPDHKTGLSKQHVFSCFYDGTNYHMTGIIDSGG